MWLKDLGRVVALVLMPYMIGSVSTIAAPGRGRFVPDELVCRMLTGSSIESINTEFGTTVKNHQIQTDCYLLTVPQGQNAESLSVQISATVGVDFCRLNFYLAAPEGFQRSSPFVDLQASLPLDSQKAAYAMNLAPSHELASGTGVRIGLIDGGVNFGHPEFASTIGRFVSRRDYIDNDELAHDESGGTCSGHGTFIAGLLHTVAPASEIFVYRVLDTGGFGDGFSIASAVLQAIDDGCRVINLSLGMVGVHDALDDALKLAKQHNVLVVASAGNDSTDVGATFPFPASRTYCLAIAALDSSNVIADFSNYGIKVAACAPGTGIYSTFLNTSYAWWDGTSFAAPFAAGLIALVYSVDSTLSWEQMDTILSTTATSVDSLNPGFEGLLGGGLINPLAALQSALSQVRGDVNGDRTVDISDINGLVDFLSFTSAIALPISAADIDCNRVIDISDLFALIDYLVLGVLNTCNGL